MKSLKDGEKYNIYAIKPIREDSDNQIVLAKYKKNREDGLNYFIGLKGVVCAHIDVFDEVTRFSTFEGAMEKFNGM